MDQTQQVTLALTCINTLFQALSLIFLIIYVIKTWEMASSTRKSAEATEKSVAEMRETRVQESAPYVIAYVDIPQDRSQLLYLVIKNIGKTTAHNVRIQIEPPLQVSNQERLDRLAVLSDGISSMPPNYEIRTFLDTAPAYLSDSSNPLRYKVSIKFVGGLPPVEQSSEQVLDLLALKGLMSIRRYDIHDLVERVEKLVSHDEHIKKALVDMAETFGAGITLRNPYIFTMPIRIVENDWAGILNMKLREFGYCWLVTKEKRESGFETEPVQRQALVTSEQLQVLLSLNEHVDHSNSRNR